MRRNLVLVLGLATFVALCALPTPAGLSPTGQRALAIFVLCAIGWIGRPVDPAVTGLTGLALLSLLGITAPSDVFSRFGSEGLFFLIALFVFASAILNSGLVGYLFDRLIRRLKPGTESLAAGVLLSSFALSACMLSQVIATAVLPPLLERSRTRSGGHRGGFSGRLLSTMAFGTAIGSTVTFLAGPQNILAAELGAAITGQVFGGWDHIRTALPFAILSLPVCHVALRLFFGRADSTNREGRSDVVELSGVRTEGRHVGIVFGLTIAGLAFTTGRVSVAAIMLGGMTTLFVLRTTQWKNLEEWVPWGTLLAYGSAVTVAMALHDTGAAEWLGSFLVRGNGVPPVLVVGGATWIAMLATAASGHPGLTIILLPVALEAANGSAFAAPALVAPLAIAAGLGVLLSSRTPATAMIVGTGLVDARTIVIRGWLLAHVLWSILVASCFVW